MKIEYDKKVDALYIRIQEKDVARTQEVSDGVNLDFDGEGRLIGLEVLSASKRYPSADIFNLSTENLILNDT
ncbi:MAG TPA: DUF2283 domain-containing protein [Candidatus Binatia bacterium]|nr:DUF2283 domain-containing protein [Candidatus Binatia bacterium]